MENEYTMGTSTEGIGTEYVAKMLSPQETQFVDIFLKGIAGYVDENLDTALAPIRKRIDESIEELTSIMETQRLLTVEYNGIETTVGTTHKQFEMLLKSCATKQPVMMVGPAGSGKTMAARQVADALSIPFHSISVGSQTSQSHLLGYVTATGNYVPTEFRRAYEYGGLFLIDEVDAGNPNVLIVINQALSSSSAPFPDGMVEKHDDFLIVGTANTFGLGADRMYVGRNQLDAATLDRFIVLDWAIDEDLERTIVSPYANGLRFHRVVLAVREAVRSHGIRAVVSPRMTMRGAMLMENGLEFEDALKLSMPKFDHKNHEDMVRVAQEAWSRS